MASPTFLQKKINQRHVELALKLNRFSMALAKPGNRFVIIPFQLFDLLH